MAPQGGGDVDVRRTSPTSDADVVSCLALQGFCVLDACFDHDVLRQAQQDAQRIDRFAPPPEMIVEGLLGSEGSGEVAELESPLLAERLRTDGAGLRRLDAFLTDFAADVDPYLEQGLGFRCGERTVSLLHRSGTSFEDPPDLTEKLAGRWINIFRRHRLMVVVCLARRGGTFQLQPFDDESDEESVSVGFGQVLVLRADALSHVYVPSADGDLVLTTFLLDADRSGPRGALADGRSGPSMTPVVEDLVEWASNRLAIIKAQEEADGGSLADMEVPRSWKLLASHSVSKGVQIAVRGIACNVAQSCETLQKHLCALSVGTDFAQEVPFARWDHFDAAAPIRYDPSPECWRTDRLRTDVRHGTFIEGVELFDNKFFNMSPMEAKGLDPTQRLALHHAYEALFMAGYVKKKLMQAFIGVYQGHTASDWDKVPHEGGMTAGSYSPTIASNRISFALGLMGPSFTVDLEGAASLAAVYQGCHDLLPSGDFRKPLTAAGLAGGVTMNLSPYWWPVHGQFMNPAGRCFSFDASSAGYVKGEGSSLVVLKRHAEEVEGELVEDESQPNLGIVSGWSMVNSGRSASLTAPSAPAIQQAVADCVRYAAVSPLDVDAVECDAKGNLLHDAVEALSVVKQLRDLPRGEEEVLALSAQKTKLGFCQETAGVAAFVTAILGSRYGSVPGNLHLSILNPHARPDDDEVAAVMPSEMLAFRCRSSFTGVSAYGMGGSNVHTVVWGSLIGDVWPEQRPQMDSLPFTFWPGGGGELEDGAVPRTGYSIVGSWSCWEQPERMKEESGAYTAVVVLGANRFEDFQIWMDGDGGRVLCPSYPFATGGAPLLGPLPPGATAGRSWRIDGRSRASGERASSGVAGLEHETGAAVGSGEAFPPRSDDVAQEAAAGLPGDRYRVTLRFAGKWRTVVWDRLPSLGYSRLELEAICRGRYYLAATWAGWEFQEMAPDIARPGWCSVEATLPRYARCEFRIVRNRDWSQSFFPLADAVLQAGVAVDVAGPDLGTIGSNWSLDCPGRTCRIEFFRRVDGEDDERSLVWRQSDRIGA